MKGRDGGSARKVILEDAARRQDHIAFALNEHPRSSACGALPLAAGSAGGAASIPWGRGLINFEPREEARAMETYGTWVRLFDCSLLLLDRRSLPRLDPGLAADAPRAGLRLGGLDAARALGFRLVLCTRDPGSFAAARAERIKVSGKPAQYDDLDVFVREQALVRDLAAESCLPRLDLDVTGIDPAQAAERIADWLEATGGLHAPELPR
jgi:hypothetical protein